MSLNYRDGSLRQQPRVVRAIHVGAICRPNYTGACRSLRHVDDGPAAIHRIFAREIDMWNIFAGPVSIQKVIPVIPRISTSAEKGIKPCARACSCVIVCKLAVCKQVSSYHEMSACTRAWSSRCATCARWERLSCQMTRTDNFT